MRNRSKTAAAWLSLLWIGAALAAADEAPTGSGPYPAQMLQEASLPQHTLYRPRSLRGFDQRHGLPLVLWGNGGCVNAGNSSQAFLTEVASHGYLVIASGPIRDLTAAPPPKAAAAPDATGAPARVGPPPGAPGTENLSQTSQLKDALDWADAQSRDHSSQYFHRLNTGKVAVMGVSCGGLQALELSPDPRISTTVLWSSGLLDYPRAGANATRAQLAQLHAPVLYVIGGDADMAAPMARRDFADITVPIVLLHQVAVGHGGTLSQPNGGGWGSVGVAWLDWQLKDDPGSKAQFVGAQCGLCTVKGWSVRKKKIDSP